MARHDKHQKDDANSFNGWVEDNNVIIGGGIVILFLIALIINIII